MNASSKPWQLPIVDLSCEPAKSSRDLHLAFIETGFAYISNHGIDSSLTRELHQLAKLFFAQPSAEKNRLAMSRAGAAWRGFFAVGDELTAGSPDQKEGLYFGVEHSATHQGVTEKWPMHGKNQWPQASDLRRMQPVILEYMNAMCTLGHRLMVLVASGLGLEASYFRSRFSEDPTQLFRIFHYPHVAGEESLWGVGEHTDMGFLTILLQDNSGGLEVQDRSGKWHEVEPLENTFVINIGDMLQHWTHGIYRATLHRVRASKHSGRLSFPFFFDPHWRARLEPIDSELLRAGELKKTSSMASQNDARWDGLDIAKVSHQLTYGDFVWAKIKDVFPDLAQEV